MLEQAFRELGPHLAGSYRQLLGRELEPSPELSSLHGDYLDYALLDRVMPRPILAYFGFHAASDAVTFDDADAIGDGLLLPQLLRDFLAIHDDIVDEDLDKFGASPLPVTFSGPDELAALTKQGKDLALFYGDLLIAILFKVAQSQPAPAGPALVSLITQTLYTNQRGQLAELLAEQRPLSATTVEDVLLIGERKAAHYCYEFPFSVGAILAGHSDLLVAPVRDLLLRIGTASQVIDDITGAFPHVIDDDKDTLGEIIHLRRTIPLVLLAQARPPRHISHLLEAKPPLQPAQALVLRDYMYEHGVPAQASRICQRMVSGIHGRFDELPTGPALAAYLRDLVHHRLVAPLNRLNARTT